MPSISKVQAWVVGDVPRFSNHYWLDDAGSTPADPNTVTLSFMPPSGTIFSVSLENPTVGQYYADVTLAEAGLWRYRWEATAPVPGADEDILFVQGSGF
jgi:hypothetical protein